MNSLTISRSFSARIARCGKQFGLGAGLALLALSAATASFAQGTFYVVTEDNRLGTVNVTNGAYTNIGNLGLQLTDIAVISSGALYGVSFDNLYSINGTTGAATLIGSLGATSPGMNALVFRNNTLFGASTDNTNLYTINVATGAASVVGNIGFSSAGDLAFDNLGNLYLSSTTNQLIRVNPTTGAGVAVGSFGTQTDMFGMAFQASGSTLFGYSYTTNQIVTINRNTGAATAVATNQGPKYFGTAFIGEATVVVPEANTAALLGFALPMIGAITVARRRKA